MAKNRHFLRKFALLSALCLSGCAVNLGAFEKSDGYESYYDSLGDVTGLYDGGSHEYSVKYSLFNKLTVEKFSWEKDSYKVESEQYLYLIIPFEKNLTIEDIVLYAYSPETITITVSAFYFSDASETPQKIKYLSSPETEPEYDEDGNYIGEKEIEYDDELVGQAIMQGDVTLPREEWKSFVMVNFQQPGYDDKYLHTGQDSLLYIRIENNSGWNVGKMTPVTFSFINLMMRAI